MTFLSSVWAKIGFLVAACLLTIFALLNVLWALERMDERTASRVARERDAHWTAQIERSNAEAERARAEQARAAIAQQIAAQAEIDRLRAEITEIEHVNAALPGADACGLDAQRVRRLPR